jgi:hypothetical protein
MSLRFQAGDSVQPQQCRLKSQQTHVAKDGVELESGECDLAAEPFKLDEPADGDPARRESLREADQANGRVGSRSATPVDLAREPVLELVRSHGRVRVATDREGLRAFCDSYGELLACIEGKLASPEISAPRA